MKRRNEHSIISKVDDEYSKMIIARRNSELLHEIINEMMSASNYVHEHKLYPSGWSNIMRTYYELRQQEEQEKQKFEITPAEPKKDKPAKSTGLRHH